MTATDRPTEPPVECVAVDRDERCLCPGGPASHRPSPPAPAAEDDAVDRATEACRRVERRRAFIADVDLPGEYARAALDAAGVSALRAEVEKLRQWKAEALPVMAGLQDLGDALGVGLGQSITGAGVEKARDLLARATSAEQERDEARQQVADLRADAVVVARALLDERGQVAAEPAAWRILAGSGDVESPAPNVATSEGRDKAVATSGEQPGEGHEPDLSDGTPDDEGKALPAGLCYRCQRPADAHRPAPVTPGLRIEGSTPDGLGGRTFTTAAPVVPDSAGLRLCEEGVTRRGEFEPCDLPAVALRRDPELSRPYPVCKGHVRGDMVPLPAVLSVVGQGVTAAEVWDEGYEAGWRKRLNRNPYRAVVRSSEQGGE